MADILDIATKIDSPLQLIGVLIIARAFIAFCAYAYKTIHSFGQFILGFRKVDVKVDKDDVHIDTHLRQ